MKKRRSYSREFKREAAGMVLARVFYYREVYHLSFCFKKIERGRRILILV